MTETLEGTLWKWTNYFTGWQPRWFVLENDILSYYKSEDDVINGCKGSIKMSVCDVNVHPTDNTRLDLIIPGEAHFYVKSATPQERQLWLVALGSCKACLKQGSQPPLSPGPTGEISSEDLRSKKSELRLYCDLLMQQVHSVKDSVTNNPVPDVQKLNEATSLLSATCDTFIATLEDCVSLANAQTQGAGPPAEPPSPSGARKSHIKTNNPWGNLQRSASVDRYIPPNMRGHRTQKSTRSGSRSRTQSESSELSLQENKSEKSNSQTVKVNGSPNGASTAEEMSLTEEDDELEKVVRLPTFFGTMPSSFMDIQLQEDGGVPTTPFLDACRPVLEVFDKLHSTAFAPVKLDIAGNIRKIQQKQTVDPEKFVTLQSMVVYEIEHRQEHLSHSATCALLWLKRALEFIREFLFEMMTSSQELDSAATAAYAKTLRRYHGMVVRGVFALAVKAIPYRKDFISHMAINSEDAENTDFGPTLMKDIEDYITALDVVLQILKDFYKAKGLDSDEQI